VCSNTSEALLGPPSVSTWTVSNTWKARIAVMTTVNSVTGASSGQVTRRKRAPPPRAPSIAAA
jgi:hypothetical protein